MGTFNVTGPDGKKFTVNAPEGSTQEDAIKYVAQKHYGVNQSAQRVNAPEEQPSALSGALEKASRILEKGGRGAIKGGAALADLPADLSNFVGDKFGDLLVAAGVPEDIAHPDVERTRLSDSDFVQWAGKPLQDETRLEQAAGTFGEWALPGMGVTKMLRAPGYGLDVLSGMGAAMGEQIAGEGGELVGGMMPVVGSLTKSFVQNKLPVTMSAEEGAHRFIMENAENPERAMKNLETALAKGEKGTLAELTDDRMIYNIEAYMPKGSRKYWRLEDLKKAREEQIIDETKNIFPDAQPASAQQAAQDIVENRAGTIRTVESERLNRAAQEAAEQEAASQARIAGFEDDIARAEQMETLAEQGVKGAEDAAAAAKAEATLDAPAADASADLATALRDSAADFKALERKPVWKEFDELEAIPSKPFGYDSILGPVEKRFPSVIYEAAKRKYKDVFDSIGDASGSYETGWPSTVQPKEVHALYQKLKSATKQARNKGEYGPEETLLDTVADNLDKALKESDVSVPYRRAKEAYEKEMQIYKPGKLGEAVRADDINVATKNIVPKGAEGTTVGGQFQTLVNDLRARGKTELADRVETAFANRVRSTVGEVGAAKFLKQYGDLTDYLPEELVGKIRLAAETEEVATGARQGLERARTKAAQQKMDATRGAAREEATVQPKIMRELDVAERGARAKAAKAQKGLESRITAKYAADPKGTVKQLLKNEADAPKLKRLNDIMVKRGEGDAFKASVRDSLSETLFKTEAGVEKATPASIDAFLKQRKSLVDSGVLTDVEADDILKSLDKTKGQIMRKNAAVQKLDDMGNEFDNLLASMLAAGGMGVFKTNSLVIAGAMRRQFRAWLKKMDFDPAKLDAVEEFMLNPEAFLKHVEPSTDPKKYAANLTRLLTRKQIADADKQEGE